MDYGFFQSGDVGDYLVLFGFGSLFFVVSNFIPESPFCLDLAKTWLPLISEMQSIHNINSSQLVEPIGCKKLEDTIEILNQPIFIYGWALAFLDSSDRSRKCRVDPQHLATIRATIFPRIVWGSILLGRVAH